MELVEELRRVLVDVYRYWIRLLRLGSVVIKGDQRRHLDRNRVHDHRRIQQDPQLGDCQ